MVTIGERFAAVEEGWRRIDNKDTDIGLCGLWTTSSSTSTRYGGTVWVISNRTTPLLASQSFVQFRFTGDRLRIYFGTYSTYSNDVLLTLDGQEYHLRCDYHEGSTSVDGRLVFETVDLDPGKIHDARLVAADAYNDGTGGQWSFDCIDIAEDAVTLPCPGMNKSTIPAGLNMYNSMNDHLRVFGKTATMSDSHSFTGADGDYLEFNFYGSKLYLVSYTKTTYSNLVEYWFDGALVGSGLHYHSATSAVHKISFVWESKDGKPGTHHLKLVNRTSHSSYLYTSVAQIHTDGYMVDWSGEYIDTTPVQTTATTPWGVSCSTVLDTSHPVQGIANGTSQGYGWYAAKNKFSDQWTAYDCKAPHPCNAFSIGLNDAQNMPYLPKRFRFEGSFDGIDWTPVAEFEPTEWVFPTKGDVPFYNEVFRLPRTVNFSRYRLVSNGAYSTTATMIGYSSWRLYITQDAERYLLKTADGYKGIDAVNKALVPAQLSDLNGDFLQSPHVAAPEDIMSVTDQIVGTDVSLGHKLRRKVSISGPIGDTGMLVFAFDTYTAGAEHIRNMALESLLPGTSVCKFALSVDSGNTWYTHKDGQFSELAVDIADKPYAAMSAGEQAKFVSARDKILAEGIAPSDMVGIDWNSLGIKKIRLAVALNRASVGDDCSVSRLTWRYDEKSRLLSCDDSVDRIILGDTFMLKARRALDKMLVNVLTHGA